MLHEEATETDVVRTTAGRIQGRVIATAHGDVRRFAGVPYGAAPTGQGRFRAARAVEPWEGVRPAFDFGLSPVQAIVGPFSGAVPGMGVTTPVDEDCLTVNVFTPADGEERLPVLVWIYGGAFVIGGGSVPTYDGARLAAEQHVIVVTLNYRVGCFGFVDLRSVPGGDDTDTNCGLRDMLLAVDWVRDNISAFGGDPARITLFGESAGAGSIMHLLTTPNIGARISGAIAQSPGVDFSQQADTAARVAAVLLAAAGATSVADLRALPAGRLLEAQLQVSSELLFEVGTMVFHPVVDGHLVPATPSVAIAAGAAADVALLIGSTVDEMRLFPDPRADSLSRQDLVRWTRGYLSARLARDPGEAVASELLARYELAARGSSRPKGSDVWAALSTDGIMRLPATRIADAHAAHAERTYAYEFAWQSIGDVDRGAFHAIDLPFVFDTFDAADLRGSGDVGNSGDVTGSGDVEGWGEFLGIDDEGRAIGRAMRSAWAAFAATGEPSCAATGTWPRYGTARSTMVFGGGSGAVDDPMAERRTWWDGLWSDRCVPFGVPL